METKLWILGETKDNYTLDSRGHETYTNDSPFRSIYDCNNGFIIEAETEQQAREIAADAHADEGRDAWLNSKWSFCDELKPDGEPGIWMRDFHAG